MIASWAVWSVERRVGRLVEIRIYSPITVAETIPWSAAHDEVVGAIRGPYACFVDLVDATIFSPEAVAGYVRTMRNEERLLRTGTLLNASPTFGLQIQRMIREANHPERRAFRDPGELFAWLGDVLDAAEKQRLRELLVARGLSDPLPQRGA